jgi:uncharacterized protein YecT (DUF1311 family)
MLLTLVFAAATVQGGCADATTQLDMNRCAQVAWQRADAAMTREWQASYAAMKARDAADTSRGGGFGYAGAALNSQRAWLKFRDTQCVLEAGRYAGGSMQPLARFNCLERLTKERAQQLRDLRRQN